MYQQAQEDLEAAGEEMANEDDAEMREMAQEEIKDAKANIERPDWWAANSSDSKIRTMGVTVFLEIRAGAGGDEAGILQVTFSVCTLSLPRKKAGALKSDEQQCFRAGRL